MTAEASIDIDESCTATAGTYSNHDASILSDNVRPLSPLLHEVRIQNDSTLPIAVVCHSYHQGSSCALFDGPADGTSRGGRDTIREWYSQARIPDGKGYAFPIQRIVWASDGRQDVVTTIDAFSFAEGLPLDGTSDLRLTITATSP